MNAERFNIIKERVCLLLKGLNPSLTYHNLDHTLDVLEKSERIGVAEGISPCNILLIKIAALYHDTGFIYTYANHEEKSCQIFMEDARSYGLSDTEIETINNLIMATRVPQRPSNLMESVICDADLDYLGRDDFFTIGSELKKEFLTFGIVHNDEEWNALQRKFLNSHHYHTASSRALREQKKQENLMVLP